MKKKNWKNTEKRDMAYENINWYKCSYWLYIERKDFLYYLSEITEIIGIDRQKILAALNNKDLPDFEDSLQDQCARAFKCDYIITRNIKDFANSGIRALLQDDFLILINE